MSESKRLSEAELAAEFQRAMLDAYRNKVHHNPLWQRDLDRMIVVRRFAVRPHFDAEGEGPSGNNGEHV